MKIHYLSLAVVAVFGLLALGSTDGDSSLGISTDTTLIGAEALPTTSPPQSKADYLEQIDREIASIRTFDGSKYRDTKDAINIEIILFGAWAKLLADSSSHELSSSEKSKVRELRRLVSETQIREFPRLRAAWARVVGQAMWEHNVTITAAGEGSRTLRMTAALFASNANIQEIQTSLHDQLVLLRFRRAEYRWYRGADEYTYYSIEAPRDGTVRQITAYGWER